MASAYEYALNLLAARAYTTRNLHRKLAQKQFPLEDIGAAVERLTRAGLLDDLKFAEAFARQRLVVGDMSPRRIEQKLISRGISGADARAAVQRVLENETIDRAAGIERVARRRAAAMSGLEPRVRERRLFAFLARRGFSLDEIRSVAAKVLS